MDYRYVFKKPSELKCTKPYQRTFEKARELNILKSIQKDGYWPEKPITIDECNNIVAGQHRWRAALACGLPLIPCIIRNFHSYEAEVLWFIQEGESRTQLKPIVYWDARYEAEDILALIIYRLNEDDQSMLHNKIATKGHLTKKSKFGITDILFFISMICGNAQGWTSEWDKELTRRVTDMGYETIKNKMNIYISWLFACFGNSKTDNPRIYRNHVLRAVTVFYKYLLDGGFITSNFRETVKKMGQYVITAESLRLPQSTLVDNMVNFFNRGKKKHLLCIPTARGFIKVKPHKFCD
jgi:hypothetical protein